MGRPALTDKVVDRMLRRLASGKCAAGSQLAPARELAAHFGVSLRTMMASVRRLSRMGLVEVRQRRPVVVLEGASERATALLRPHAETRASPRVALLVPDNYLPVSRYAFYRALIEAVLCEAERQNLRAEVVPWRVDEQPAVVNELLRSSFDGAVFIGLRQEFMVPLKVLADHGFPLLVFNRRIRGLDLPTVVIDDYRASRRMAEHLARLGHRNLCMVAHPSSFAEADDKTYRPGKASGWVDYLTENGLLGTCIMPLYLPWETASGPYCRAFRQILSQADRPTAIVFAHNPYARAFLADLTFSSLDIPGDMSLAAFEPTSNLPSLPGGVMLTSIDIDYARTAQCITETALMLLAGNPHPPVIRVLPDIHLTDSIGPAP